MPNPTQDLELLYASSEATEGTAESAPDAADVVRCLAGSIRMRPVPIDIPDMDVAADKLWTEEPAASPQIIHYASEFTFPLRKAAAAGSAPEGAQVLLAHGCNGTSDAGVDYTFSAPAAPNAGTDYASLTLFWQKAQDLVHKSHGARVGQLKFSWQAGGMILAQASNVLGGYSDPSTFSAFTTPTYADAGPVGPLDVATASPVQINSVDLFLTSYEMTSAMQLQMNQHGAGGTPDFGFDLPGTLGRQTQPAVLVVTYLAPKTNAAYQLLKSQASGHVVAINHGSSGVDAKWDMTYARLRSFEELGGRPAQVRATYTLHTDRDRATAPWTLTMAAA